MKNKILAIIYRKVGKITEFLALRNNPADPVHGGDFYYVVTGGVEEGEKSEDALRREIKEETGIEKIISVKDTGKIYKYSHPGEGEAMCKEVCFLVEVDGDIHHLSDEHIGYKWLHREEFINTVHWYYSKEDLIEQLNPLAKPMNEKIGEDI